MNLVAICPWRNITRNYAPQKVEPQYALIRKVQFWSHLSGAYINLIRTSDFFTSYMFFYGVFSRCALCCSLSACLATSVGADVPQLR